MTTGSELFSDLNCFHTNTVICQNLFTSRDRKLENLAVNAMLNLFIVKLPEDNEELQKDHVTPAHKI